MIYKTAATLNEVYTLCTRDRSFENVLDLFFSRKALKDEFRQHLWLQITEMGHDFIVDVWNRREFRWLYVRIVTNQVKSSSSTWAHDIRKSAHPDVEQFTFFLQQPDEPQQEEQLLEEQQLIQRKKSIVLEALDHYSKVDAEFAMVERPMFESYYMHNKTYRDIEKEYTLPNGERINYLAIRHCVEYARTLVRHYIKVKTQANPNYLL